LADLTGMSKAFIGLILMAAVTSLPELMVGFSAAAVIESADLATGDILGSCAFNLGILFTFSDSKVTRLSFFFTPSMPIKNL